MSELSLSKKLYFGFGAVLLIMIALAATTTFNLISIDSSSSNYVDYAQVDKFIVAKQVDHFKWLDKLRSMFLENRAGSDVEKDHTKCGLGLFLHGEEGRAAGAKDPEAAEMIEAMMEPHRRLHESVVSIEKVWRQIHPGLEKHLHFIVQTHLEWANQVSLMLLKRDPAISVNLDHTSCALGKFLQSDAYREYVRQFPQLGTLMDGITEPHRALHQAAGVIQESLRQTDIDRASGLYADSVLPLLQKVQEGLHEAVKIEGEFVEGQVKALALLKIETIPALEQTRTHLDALSSYLSERAESTAEGLTTTVLRSKRLLGFGSAAAVILGIILSILLARSITGPVNRIIASLASGSEQVNSASSQIATVSQNMAQGSSEQASSLEETSASLEQIASMTRQNADNAQQANIAMTEAKDLVASGVTAMAAAEELSSQARELQSIITELTSIVRGSSEVGRPV